MTQHNNAKSQRVSRGRRLLPLTLLGALAPGLVGLFPASAVDGTDIITTIAGNGAQAYTGDGMPATSTALNHPAGVAVDSAGSIYLADRKNARIRKIDSAGIITTIAGTGVRGFAGDGGPARTAQLAGPLDLEFDAFGNLYVLDSDVVRKIDSTGTITRVVGAEGSGVDTGEGGSALTTYLSHPTDIALDPSGRMVIAEPEGNRVRRVERDGTITTIAGTGTRGFSGDGSQARAARLNRPSAVAYDTAGNLFVADTNNNRVREVTTGGVISTVAGYAGTDHSDFGYATSTALLDPVSLCFDQAGNLYIGEWGYSDVRRVDTNGYMTRIAGGGKSSPGDGGPAINATLSDIGGLRVDQRGRLLLVDPAGSRVRVITPVRPGIS